MSKKSSQTFLSLGKYSILPETPRLSFLYKHVPPPLPPSPKTVVDPPLAESPNSVILYHGEITDKETPETSESQNSTETVAVEESIR